VNGILGRKIGMTSFYDDTGKNVACTVIEAGPCVVTQVKTVETDGYNALQLGFGEKREKNSTQPLMGHFAKANTPPKKYVAEFRDFGLENGGKELGDEVSVGEVFEEGDIVDVVGTSKGKGFQGVIRRHGFSGGSASHGDKNQQRAPGSIGAAATPSKVVKGKKMAGQMGNTRVKIQNLEVLKVHPEQNLIVIKGAVPGYNGSFVIIEK